MENTIKRGNFQELSTSEQIEVSGGLFKKAFYKIVGGAYAFGFALGYAFGHATSR